MKMVVITCLLAEPPASISSWVSLPLGRPSSNIVASPFACFPALRLNSQPICRGQHLRHLVHSLLAGHALYTSGLAEQVPLLPVRWPKENIENSVNRAWVRHEINCHFPAPAMPKCTQPLSVPEHPSVVSKSDDFEAGKESHRIRPGEV